MDIVAHVDLSDCWCRCLGRNIATDVWLLVSQLNEMALPGPGHVLGSHAVTHLQQASRDLIKLVVCHRIDITSGRIILPIRVLKCPFILRGAMSEPTLHFARETIDNTINLELQVL